MLNIFAEKIQEFRNFLTCMLKVKNSIWFIYAYGRGRLVLNQWNDSALALIVQTLDSNIHWIKHYPMDSVKKTNCVFCWIGIYPVVGVIHHFNNWALTIRLMFVCRPYKRLVSLKQVLLIALLYRKNYYRRSFGSLLV